VPRYKLTIAYDGTDFCGWQKQEPPMPEGHEANRPVFAAARQAGLQSQTPGRAALRTVQAVVERAVRETVREPVQLKGASRTDSGVHAKGQVAAFTCSPTQPPPPPPTEPPAQAGGPDDTSNAPHLESTNPSHTGWPTDRGLDRLVRAINGKLPEDVQVLRAQTVPDNFNPIADCLSKGYSYTLHASLTRPLWDRTFVQQVWTRLDIERMRAAAAQLVGQHDFAAFAAASHGRQTTIRTIHACTITDLGPIPTLATGSDRDWSRRLRIDVSGNGFLYNMVRIIAGTLVEVGRGKMAPNDITTALNAKDRTKTGPTLPGKGLCLEWIKYPQQTP
jgi:tRNA pseudouridine38-40 synthase